MPSVEAAQGIVFTTLFPLTFVSNVFVPTSTLPDFLRPIAEWNPVSVLTAATRQLWGNPNPFAATGLPAEQPVLLTLIWVVVIVVVCGTLSVRRYRGLSRQSPGRATDREAAPMSRVPPLHPGCWFDMPRVTTRVEDDSEG